MAHDLLKKTIKPDISERRELLTARIAAGVAVLIAGYFGINPPGFVAEVVALAFGLAAASFFPAIILGIFTKGMNKYGAVSGMVAGIGFTASYIVYFKLMHPELNNAEHWWFGVSPEGIGTLGMLINVVVAVGIAFVTPPPPLRVQQFVEEIRVPRGAGPSRELSA